MLAPAFIQNIGIGGLVVILVIVLILFGPGQLPKVMEMFGKSVKSFRDGQRDDKDAANRLLQEGDEAEEIAAQKAREPEATKRS